MRWIQASFNRMEGIYARLFADWLHISFIMRTVMLILMLWIIIIIGALAFKYVIGPLLMRFYINVMLRAWNFIVVETVQEWIYIHHYSKGSPRFSGLYMRLTDSAKHNRALLAGGEENAVLQRKRVRRFGNQMMVAACVIVAMWVVAFGINQEYTAPVWVASGDADENAGPDDNGPEPQDASTGDESDDNATPHDANDIPGLVRPGQFPDGAQISMALTGDAQVEGARLRNAPGTADSVVIEMLWGDETLVYLGHYVADADVDTLYWLRVRSLSGEVGYIGSHLVVLVSG